MDAVSGSLVADLGVGPETWLVISLLASITLFFKFGRVWSIRNLDLLLFFAPAPGMMLLVGHRGSEPWIAFAWLLLGSTFWLVRCLIDLGMVRRPMLEPNLNAAGLSCMVAGVLGLILVETVNLPFIQGENRNPAGPGSKDPEVPNPPPPGSMDRNAAVNQILHSRLLPDALKTDPRPEVILSRVLAGLGHFGLAAGLIAVGWRHFERPIAGLAMAACYLISPFSRIALVDGGQVVPSALIVTAFVAYRKPAVAGALIGLAGGWMPACLGLVPLWAGFYRKGGLVRFGLVAALIAAGCGLSALAWPELAAWARALGARSLTDAGLWPGGESPASGSFWVGINASYRSPVLIGYLALVILTSFWPVDKDLGQLIASTAALLVASQFWYLDRGGTLVVLYLPVTILMVFRPNLAQKRPSPRIARPKRIQATLFPVR